MKCWLTHLFVIFSIHLFGQNPIPLQVSYSVFFEDVKFPHLQSADLKPIGHLCGISSLFLDTISAKKEIIISDLEAPVIVKDRVGISSKLSIITTDSSRSITELEFLYSNNTCAVSISKNDSIICIGNFTPYDQGYAIRIIGSKHWYEEIRSLLYKVNDHLLRLHGKKLKYIPVSGLYNPDSLNVIMGPDHSFDTNYDLTWFDGSIRKRVKTAAQNAYETLSNNALNHKFQDTIRSNSFVVHTALKNPKNEHEVHGKVSTIFKLQGQSDYLFLKAQKEYLMEISYIIQTKTGSMERFRVEKFSIKNMENGDFIEMEVFDLVGSGVPILYVDLISGVVMEDGGAWRADQFITAIQDVFRLVKLPGEG